MKTEARRRKITLAKGDDREQKWLHEAASKFFGVLTDGDPNCSVNVRQIMRERLRQRCGR
jgi:hypothetical protein